MISHKADTEQESQREREKEREKLALLFSQELVLTQTHAAQGGERRTRFPSSWMDADSHRFYRLPKVVTVQQDLHEEVPKGFCCYHLFFYFLYNLLLLSYCHPHSIFFIRMSILFDLFFFTTLHSLLLKRTALSK